MNIDAPKHSQLPALKALWQEAFGDTEAFLNVFEKTAFSANRCRCITDGDKTVAALYWFDCSYCEGRIVYLYAIATAKSHRGQGLCKALMENTHAHLKQQGYRGAILVPGSPELFSFYQKMGYRTCASVDELRCEASKGSVTIRQIDTGEYAKIRRSLLPHNGVVQENENLEFLKHLASFYVGDGFLLAARGEDDTLYGLELLGNKDTAPAILNSLGYTKGVFRTQGASLPFAMFYPLDGDTVTPPSYFGFAFD